MPVSAPAQAGRKGADIDEMQRRADAMENNPTPTPTPKYDGSPCTCPHTHSMVPVVKGKK